MKTLVHVTHEAVQKIGGIGAVLDGLLTSPVYADAVERTLIVGPLFSTDGPAHERLGPDGEVLYSSVDGLISHPVAAQLGQVQHDYNVDIVYGHRRLTEPGAGRTADPEVLLIDVRRGDGERLNQFKFALWEQFWIDSAAYERYWEYEQYIRLAPPAIAALHALGACGHDNSCVILAHEFMGMPTALAALLDGSPSFRTVFYAHEVAPIRKIVEDHRGHDTMFYNALEAAKRDNTFVEDVFGSQHHYFKHALVEAARNCHEIFAVGDYVVDEMRFLGPGFTAKPIDIVYNGVPSVEATPADIDASKEMLRTYCETLLGHRPDFIFSHVTRLVTSKGLWRDLRVLETIERRFRETGETAVLFVLATEAPARRPEDVRHMEQWWKWPVAHREGMPDLSGGEAVFYAGVQEFNARARQVKIVFVNQFGWSRPLCGERMPAEMDLLDLRKGSDLEFGQSIYEPFGIAQLEPLTFGGLCVVTNVCGCAGFVNDATGGAGTPNVIVADYTRLEEKPDTYEGLLAIDADTRERVEARVAVQVGEEILRRLPRTDDERAAALGRGYALARQMSWDTVARDYFLPGIERAIDKHAGVPVAV